MGTLVVILALLGLGAVVAGIALSVRLWTVLGMHRQAMHALHQELAQRRLERHLATQRRVTEEFSSEPTQDASTAPPASPHSIWRTGPGTGI